MRTYFAWLAILVGACSEGGPLPGPSAPATPTIPNPMVPTTRVVASLPRGPHDSHVASADVSIMFPIDAATDRGQLIAPIECGNQGPLLPEDVFTRLAPFGLDSGAGGFDQLRLVGLRLDGCSAHGACASEVRAVWQPVLATPTGTYVADGAVHVMYALPADELLTLLEQILTLKKAHGAITYPDILGVHPILAATGLTGAFADGLRTIVREHLGVERITRMTLLTHDGSEGDSWSFARFERDADGFAATTIVGTSAPVQSVFGSSAVADVVGNAYGDTPSVPALAAIVSGGRPKVADDSIKAAFTAAIETQHPLQHHSENTDCVSCHVAEGARTIGHVEYGLADVGLFSSQRSLAYVRDTKSVTNLHAFGYLGTAISIMQRTANESALAADRLEAALAAQ